ncbi:prolactin-4A1-like [Grammomys surdaster]|uniref:prolactin-4A1-like n=1 Tax=Grammomys surdaster TaxID=491861 RepID=UPI0010A07862|nr:prolactin-4A1-like [Grammomys surdaster]
MHLSLTQQLSSRTVLLLLVSNLLLWENTASAMEAKMLNAYNYTSFGDTWNQAIKLSQTMNHRISELSTHFKVFYGQGRGFEQRTSRCHTSSLSFPENKEQAQKTQLEVLLGLAHSLLQAWVNPLYHLWAEMHERLGSTSPTLYKALEVKTLNRNLLEAIKKIALKGNFEVKENRNSSAWSELEFLQSPNRDTRYFAFHNLFHCLKRDSNLVEMYLKLLKCRLIQSYC